MSGFVEMEFGAVTDATNGVAESGVALSSDWRTTGHLTLGDEGAIGFDKLGMAFLRGYGGPAHRLREVGAAMPDRFFDLAAAGRSSMDIYRNADRAGADGIPG